MRRLAVLTAAVILAGGSAACGSNDPSIDPTASGSAASTTIAPSTTVAAPFEGSTTPVSTPAKQSVVHVTDVRVAGQSGFDRLVISFDAAVPGYRVSYIELPVTEDGSGKEIEVEGVAALDVRLENARMARFEGEKVVPTYTGPRRLKGDTSVLTDVVAAGDFEGVVNWAAGVKSRAPFRVSTLDSPPRLVIDVATS